MTPSRSLRAGQVTVQELRELTKSFAFAKHYLYEGLATAAYDSVVFDGDVTIDGDFNTFANKWCTVVVTGSLRIGGVYHDYDDPRTSVFVLGDLEAGSVITSGALGVSGNAVVHDVLLGDYNDHSAEIKGDVTAQVFIPENHFFGIGGKLHATYVLGNRADYLVSSHLKKSVKPITDEALRALVVPEVLDVLEYDDPDAEPEINLEQQVLKQRITARLPILKDGAARPNNAKAVAKPANTTPTAKAEAKPTAKAKTGAKSKAKTKAKTKTKTKAKSKATAKSKAKSKAKPAKRTGTTKR